MKKFLIGFILMAMIAFNGCERSSDSFLMYKNQEFISDHSMDNLITEGDFLAKDIAVIKDNQNSGGDDQLNSGAVLLVNITDNKVIYADHVFDKMYPASLTKLMTALIVLKQGELTDNVTVSDNASRIAERGAKVCGYKEGDVLSMETLLNSLLIYSGNDAAVAIAEHVGGSEEAFVTLMNKEAKHLSAVDTNFINSHGLHDDNQYTTAYDMYLIFNELLKYDTFRTMIGTDAYTATFTDKDGNEKQKEFKSTNLYLTKEAAMDPGIEAVGGLSGTTNKAGSCLILLCRDNNKKEYISIIMNAADSNSLYTQMSHLLTLTESK